MKFFLDQDVYLATLRFIEDLGHDALPAAQVGLAQASDTELLDRANQLDRILITRDRDYGGLVFVRGLGAGVIYLRMMPSSLHAVHEELARVIEVHAEEELKRAFVVVEPGRHRFRRIGSPSP